MTSAIRAPNGWQLEHVLSAHLARVRRDGSPPALLKRMPPRHRAEPLAHRRWRAGLLVSARIPSAIGARLLAHGADEQGPFLITEWLEGITLAQLLDARAPLEESLVARLWVDADARLRAAHRLRDGAGPLELVHGDVSPDNLLLLRDGTCRWLDFSLGSSREAPPWRDGVARGSLRYASAAVARGEPAGEGDDRFALALCMVHALTGAAPRQGGPAAQLLAAQAPPTVPPLRDRALATALEEALGLGADAPGAAR